MSVGRRWSPEAVRSRPGGRKQRDAGTLVVLWAGLSENGRKTAPLVSPSDALNS